MPIHLLIANNALLSAVTEQLQSAGIESVLAPKDFGAPIKSDDCAAIIMDDETSDKKIFKALSDVAAEGKKKRLFLLGDIPKDCDTNLVTESFAKPLRLGHLLSRLQFYLQTASRLNNTAVIFGPYRFEPQNRQVVDQNTNTIIRLTEKETALLDQLSQSGGAVSREDLLAGIWGYTNQIDTHTLETHIYQLRRKLDPQSSGANWLINEQGSYRLYRGEVVK